MKIVFVSNRLTFHQLPISIALRNKLGPDYVFIATLPIDPNKLHMYPDTNILGDSYFESFTNVLSKKKSQELIDNSDVVIIGAANDNYIINRLKKNKITFRYSERFYREELKLNRLPRAIFSAWKHHGRFQKYPLYMLCASAYTANDAYIFGNYRNKCFKWGYFPEVKKYDIESFVLQKTKSDCVNILWTGRFLEWKHPEKAIIVADFLKRKNINFHLNMIGTGIIFDEIKDLVSRKNLNSHVSFSGELSPDEVRNRMEKANIFLFTSDFNEGWGAVLNEAMNSGCAVLVSHAAGSVPFLVKDGVNGLIYENQDTDDLCNKALRLAIDKSFREKLGIEAYFTLRNTWNANDAARRLLILVDAILTKKKVPFIYGPCSEAELLKNNWYSKIKNGRG